MDNMQSDEHSMAEKILRDLENIILNRRIEDFVIIPISSNENKNPVVRVEYNLGLESWCIKHVYGYAYKTLLEVRKKVAKRKLLHDEYPNVNRLIIGAILINPDVATFWNMRREFFSDNLLPINQELMISKLVLSHKSKSNEAFSYRKWLLKGVLSNNTLDKSVVNIFLFDELDLCAKTAVKAQNNYHSWCHRIWCIENMLPFFSKRTVETRIYCELSYSEKWISTHVSEHSGFYYRQFIINKTKNLHFELILFSKYTDCLAEYFNSLPAKTKDITQYLLGPTEKQWNDDDLLLIYNRICLLLYDYTLNSQLQNIFLEHESLWYHRRFILNELFLLMYHYYGLTVNISTNLNLILANDERDNNIVDSTLTKSVILPQKSKENGEKCPKILKSECDLMNTSELHQFLLKTEKQLIGKYSKQKNYQGNLAERHEKWIVYILGITNL